MNGVLLIFVAVVWLIVAYFFSKLSDVLLPKNRWAYLLRWTIFLALVPLPLLDEFVGKTQFERLCNENQKIEVDRIKATGKTVYLADLPDVEIKGAWVRVVSKPWRFVDINTGEILVSYNTLQAAGGIFTQVLKISEGGVPLTFTSLCEPKEGRDPQKLLKEIGVFQIQRSTIVRGEKK